MSDKKNTITSVIDGGPVGTYDVRLASALLAMGIHPAGGTKATMRVLDANGRLPKREIFLQGVSDCGRYNTRELISAWREGLEWIRKNDEHPFAYVMASMMNHRDMLEGFRNEAKFVFLQKGKSVAMLPSDASAKLEESVLGEF